MSFQADSLTWGIGRKTVLHGLTFSVPPGQMLGLLGPNGSGKTSLLRLLAGLKTPAGGRVLLDGADLRRLPRRDVARRVAFVEQHAGTTASLTVEDVVRLGRFPHRRPLAGWTAADAQAVEAALDRAGMTAKRRDGWHSLSGGEKQRAQIARALAQTPRELILDEPTNHLDIQHQIGLLRLIAGLGITSVLSLHDLNHAAMFCDRLLVLHHGHIVADGPPAQVLTETLLHDVFSVQATVEPDPHTGRLHIRYLR